MKRLVLVALMVVTAAACAPLPAWQRGLLLSKARQDPADPDADAFDAHVTSIHETAAGASSAGGVSCGCN